MSPRVYSGGTFDLLHYGHLRFLQGCSEFGEVWVALNTDEFIERYKGERPVMSYDERSLTLALLPWVSQVVENDSEDSRPTIESVAPDIIAIGSDWARKDYYAQMGFDQDWLDVWDIKLVYIPYTDNISTTELKRRLRA